MDININFTAILLKSSNLREFVVLKTYFSCSFLEKTIRCIVRFL